MLLAERGQPLIGHVGGTAGQSFFLIGEFSRAKISLFFPSESYIYTLNSFTKRTVWLNFTMSESEVIPHNSFDTILVLDNGSQ